MYKSFFCTNSPMNFIFMNISFDGNLTFFFFNDTATTEIYTLSLHDALPIFSMTGGVILQWLLGYNFSVAVWIGYIALYGVAVETGVIMVIYLHEALDRRL